MAAKPTHVKAVAEMLETSDFADATEAAKAIFAKVDELRDADETWFALTVQVGYLGATGPFPTANRALEWLEKDQRHKDAAGVVRSRTPNYRKASLEKVDAA